MMLAHWMTTGLLGATGTFQRAAREYAEEYAAMAVAAERERCAAILKARADKISAEAERAVKSEPDEVSALRAMAWQFTVSEREIRGA